VGREWGDFELLAGSVGLGSKRNQILKIKMALPQVQNCGAASRG